MPKAIPYIRFSSLPQGQGSTVERQEEMIQAWLSNHPEYTRYTKTFKDEGKSGFHGDHLKGSLGLVKEAIENGVIVSGDVLLVEAIDRLGRLETMEMMELVHSITKAGVMIVTLQDDQTYSRERINADASCIYILIGKIQQAHDYSKSLSGRLTKAWQAKRRKAAKGDDVRMSTPYWLTSGGKLIPERAEIVKSAIGLYLKGKGHRGIVLELSEQYPEIKNIHPSTLKRWFKHKALIGEWQHERAKDKSLPTTKGVFEPLIDTATFYKLQSESAKRTKKMGPEKHYPLAGLFVCSDCGSPYHFRRKATKNDVIVYANCSQYLKRGAVGCSNNKSWPYEVVEQVFIDSYPSSLAKVSESSLISKYTSDLEVLNARISELDTQLERAFDLLIKYSNQPGLQKNIDILTSERDAYYSEKVALEADLSTDSTFVSEDSFVELQKLILENDSDPLLRRKLLQDIGYRIKGNPERLIVDYVDHGRFEYTIHKRSQKYGCYLVEVSIPEYTYPDEYGQIVAVAATTAKVALNRRDGIVCQVDAESSWDDLLELLANPPQEYEIVFQAEEPKEYFAKQIDDNSGEVLYGIVKPKQ